MKAIKCNRSPLEKKFIDFEYEKNKDLNARKLHKQKVVCHS